jgi:hypothetical protein
MDVLGGIKMKDISNLPIATDGECKERRNCFIENGIIKPAQTKLSLDIKKQRKIERKQLKDAGIIESGFCKVPRNKVRPIPQEEGEYVVKPITNDIEYNKRKQQYFRALQEILHSRRDLKLILATKTSNDPEWVF